MVIFAMRAATFAAFFLIFLITLTAAPAQQQQQQAPERDLPGRFDFYVLALSWSPTFCEAAAEQGRQPREQCGARPYSFVVHGLWPQYERGFPRSCRVPAPRLNRNIMSSMLDLMPAPRLVYQQWDQHGTCSGLRAEAYFDLVRKARKAVTIPTSYEALNAPITVDPNEVEDAFVKSNPGLTHNAIAVTCDHSRLSEVRICMTKELKFRDCPEINHRACRRERLIMPPVRGGEGRRDASVSGLAGSSEAAR